MMQTTNLGWSPYSTYKERTEITSVLEIFCHKDNGFHGVSNGKIAHRTSLQRALICSVVSK